MDSYDQKKFLAQLKRHEGAVLDDDGNHTAYICPAGYLTIGYGHNLDANPIPGLDKNSIIPEKIALDILENDIKIIQKELDEQIPWWRLLAAPRQGVLLNMAYNMGVKGLMKFKDTLQAVREMRWVDAKSGMLMSRWAGQVKRRAPELAEQMLTGKWTNLYKR